jgi:hypothetical protein
MPKKYQVWVQIKVQANGSFSKPDRNRKICFANDLDLNVVAKVKDKQ